MGYNVNVEGKLAFFNSLENFYKQFKEDEYEPYTVGYFFKYFIDWEPKDNYTYELYREGNLWYNCDEVMKLLSEFANGTVYFYGEDNESWKYVLTDGQVDYFEREKEW